MSCLSAPPLLLRALLIVLPACAAALLAVGRPAAAQGVEQWVVRHGGPRDIHGSPFDVRAVAIAVDAAGNTYVTGTVGTVKYSPAGVRQWVAQHNLGSRDTIHTAKDVAVDAAGNVYVMGNLFEYDPDGSLGEIAIIKYGADGAERGVRRYGGLDYAAAADLAVDAAGNAYVCGYSTGDTGQSGFLTVKYDPQGGLAWAARYQSPDAAADGDGTAVSLAVSADGGVYVAGTSRQGAQALSDYTTVKYDAGGTLRWARRYDGPVGREDTVAALALDGAGNVYVTGTSEGEVSRRQFATVKYDAGGTRRWARRYTRDAGQTAVARALAVDAAGNVHVTGYAAANFYEPGSECVTLKYDTQGAQLWVRNAAPPGTDTNSGSEIALDPEGNVYVAGNSGNRVPTPVDVGSTYLADYHTLKYDANGALLWSRRYNGPYSTVHSGFPSYNKYSSGNDYVAGLAVDTAGNAYVTGTSPGYSRNGDSVDEIATVKYAPNSFVAHDVALATAPAGRQPRMLWRGHESAKAWNVDEAGGAAFGSAFGPYDRWGLVAGGAGADGGSRLLWQHADGRAALWRVSEHNALLDYVVYGPYHEWAARDVAAAGPDGRVRLLWDHADGRAGLWSVASAGGIEGAASFGPYTGWRVRALSVGGDGKSRLLWTKEDGQVSLWTVSPARIFEGSVLYGPFAGWEARDLATGADNSTVLLWQHTDGTAGLWRVSSSGGIEASAAFGPYPGWVGKAISVGGDGRARLLWSHVDGRASLWTLAPGLASTEGQFVYGPL